MNRKTSIKFYVWRNGGKAWWWHGKKKGRIKCDSGQGYSRRIDALRAAEDVAMTRKVYIREVGSEKFTHVSGF